MNIIKMLAELRAERAAVEEGILVLERLAASSGRKRRGRPPAWMTGALPPSRGVKTVTFSAELGHEWRKPNAGERHENGRLAQVDFLRFP